VEDPKDKLPLIKMRILSKKGQIASLPPAVIALVLAAVLLVFGLIILQSLRDTDVVNKAATTIIINESTLTVVNFSGVSVASVGDRGASGFSAINVHPWNITDLEITSENYTFTDAGVISYIGIESEHLINNSIWNITYSYVHGEESYVGANTTLVGLGTFADFWEIIVLAVVIGVVIGLLLVVFGGKARR